MNDEAAKLRGQRLKSARERMGLKRPKDVIDRFGRQGVKSSYYQHENGSVGYSFKYAQLYGELFGVRAEWLYSGDGPVEATAKSGAGTIAAVSAPLISWISAGRLAQVDHVEDMDTARRVQAADLDPGGDWIALRVEGDSMDRISPPDSIIFVNRSDRTLVPNACYVIADESGGASYKRFRPNPDRWEPVSVNPDHEPFFIQPGNGPRIIGRVRKTVLDL